jgi:HEAT repeat protein
VTAATAGPADEARRRGLAAAAGHRPGDGDAEARRHLADPSPRVRATALAALVRLGRAGADDVDAALADPDPLVRRRACSAAVTVPGSGLLARLADPDAMVVEAAAWALGERGPAPGVVEALGGVATSHADALCRESAVAALGAIGDLAGLPAILAGTTDKPAVRRRAVLALAPFDGPEVEATLRRALGDRDWQVRQAAEDLLGDDASGDADDGD